MSSIESLNILLFQYINAPLHASSFDVHLAIFLANDTLYLLGLFLLGYWLFGEYHQKNLALKAVVTCLFALLIGYLISLFYPHSRPFSMGLGHTLIHHNPTYSFPSNHMLIFSAIACSFAQAKKYKIAGIIGCIAFLMAWSRIYVGVHFPFDMFGAVLVSVICSYLMRYIWPILQRPLMHYCLMLYHFLCAALIRRGWLSK